MHKKKSVVARRAWNFLRLALLWARKGELFKNKRLMVDLRLLPKFIKTLRNLNDHHHQRGALHYGERELSFDDTPVVHVKMHRPSSLRFKIPCISTPQVDFDYDFDRDDDHHEMYYYNDDHNVVLSRKSFLKGSDDYSSSNEEQDDEHGKSDVHEEINGTPRSCDDGIDLKAEQFIAQFYEQIKLQRQISYLQYNEMISRGAN